MIYKNSNCRMILADIVDIEERETAMCNITMAGTGVYIPSNKVYNEEIDKKLVFCTVGAGYTALATLYQF